MSHFDIVVAADEAQGIARDGQLPWHLPGDLAHFKRTTSEVHGAGMRNAVIMGRRTWESITPRFRPLPNRYNVVLSRRSSLEVDAEVLHAQSLQEALNHLTNAALRLETLFVVGGGVVYEQAVAMPECRNIYYTRIAGDFQCDTFFPPFEHAFELERVLDETQEEGTAYRIELWRRP